MKLGKKRKQKVYNLGKNKTLFTDDMTVYRKYKDFTPHTLLKLVK